MVSMSPRNVVFIAYDEITTLDLVGPMDVFDTAGRVAARDPQRNESYALAIATLGGRGVRSTSGVRLSADVALERLRRPVDTLVVVGGLGSRAAAKDEPLVRAVARVAERSRRVASVCSGAFVLAAAGLLDGRRAVTHWASCGELAARFPAVTVEDDPIFVRDGSVWTSAGVSAGMDLALALVEDDLGRKVSLETARQLVLFARRGGGQSQFSPLLARQLAERDPIRELQAWILEHVDEDLSVSALARRVAMSPRHFARVFRDEVGETPAAFVELARVEVARSLLETTGLPVEHVGEAAGFGSAPTFRRVFRRRLGVGPRTYRDRFAA